MHSLAVVGSGVVGQASGKGFIKKTGAPLTFVDVNDKTIRKLRSEGFAAIHADDMNPDTADVFFISVPTPSVNGRTQLEYMISAVVGIANKVVKASHKRHTIVVRSTVPPGTTEKLVIPLLEEESGKVAGRDFGVCMNPEYLREETAEQDFADPWLIAVGSLDDASAKTMAEVYQPFGVPVHRLTLSEAEAQKYAHNLFNACKISFFNEMREVCAKAGIEADHIFPLVAKSCEGCWNASYGTKHMGPYSGSCLPKDTSAFFGWAEDNHYGPMILLSAVMTVNEQLKTALSKNEQQEMAMAETLGQQTI